MKKNLLFKGIVLMFGFLFFNFQKAPSPPDNLVVPLVMQVWVPCADGGSGELVDFSGDLHVLLYTNVNGNRISGSAHFQPMGVKGVGQVTGDSYNATGITQDHYNFSLGNGQDSETYINNFNIIGQGRGNNFTVHETLHIAVNANGDLIISHDSGTANCK